MNWISRKIEMFCYKHPRFEPDALCGHWKRHYLAVFHDGHHESSRQCAPVLTGNDPERSDLETDYLCIYSHQRRDSCTDHVLFLLFYR